MTTTATKEQQLDDIGKAAFESIARMVEALDCDYDRLGELREERDGHDDPHDRVGAHADNAAEAWELDEPLDFAELKELEAAAGDCDDMDEAQRTISEDPLSLQVRSDWGDLGDTLEPAEFEILLSTGGPATRIVGDLDEHGEPCSARLQAQDWFTPWAEYSEADEDVLLRYSSSFFGG